MTADLRQQPGGFSFGVLDISDLEESGLVHPSPSVLPFCLLSLLTSGPFAWGSVRSKGIVAVRECCWWTPGAVLEKEETPFEETPAEGW